MVILGLIVLYVTSHMFVLLFKKGWAAMTTYEKIVAIMGTFFVGCIYFNLMFGNN